MPRASSSFFVFIVLILLTLLSSPSSFLDVACAADRIPRRDPKMPRSRRLLAVPFVGKDVPSQVGPDRCSPAHDQCPPTTPAAEPRAGPSKESDDVASLLNCWSRVDAGLRVRSPGRRHWDDVTGVPLRRPAMERLPGPHGPPVRRHGRGVRPLPSSTHLPQVRTLGKASSSDSVETMHASAHGLGGACGEAEGCG